MNKVASIKARRDEAFADLTSYLEDPEADLSVAEAKEEAFKAIEKDLLEAVALENRVRGYTEDIKAKNAAPSRPGFTFGAGQPQAAKTLGQMIVGTNQFKNWHGEVEVPSFKATLTESNLTSYDRPPGIVLLGVQRPNVADLIPQLGTESTTIRLFVENSYTNYAGMTSETGVYPAATTDVDEVDFPVRKVAVLQPVSDEMLSDHPAIMGYFDQRLPYSLAIKEDGQILSGSGSAPNLTGLLNTSGISTYAKGTVSGESNADAVHKIIAKIQATGFFAPDAMVVHPLDWDILAREKDAQGQYYGGGPFTGAYGQPGPASFMPRYWGLNVVVTTAISQGTILVGSFQNGAEIYRRQGITVEMSNSDGTTFQQGIKTIRATSRLALAVIRPKCFGTVTSVA